MSKDKVKWLIVGLVAGILSNGAVVLASKLWQEGTHRFDTVQARKVEILNDRGKVVAVLGTMKNKGRGALVIYNAVGKEVAALFGNETGGALRTKNSAGGKIAFLGASKDGGGMLEIFDQFEMLVVRVNEVLSAGQMEIYYTAAGGESGEKVVAILGPVANGGGISFRDMQGNTRAAVGTDMFGGYIIIRDKDGKPVFERP